MSYIKEATIWLLLTIYLFLSPNKPLMGQNIDINTLKETNVRRSKDLDILFLRTSQSCSPLTIVSAVGQIGYGIAQKDKKVLHNGIEAGVSIIGSSLISYALKYTVKRDRPFETYDYIDPIGDAARHASFPSGHTTAAFTMATSLSLAYPKWYVIAPSYAYAGLVGYSRLHLGVHYPSDVIIGAILGTTCSYLSHKIRLKLNKKATKRTIPTLEN